MELRPDRTGDHAEGEHAVVVFAGGSEPSRAQFDQLVQRCGLPIRVIAADSGADHALALDVPLDLAVGDFDSVSDAAQRWLHQEGCELRSHPPDKDQSDLELAMEAALESRPRSLILLGAGGGRPDHLLLNMLVLADERWQGVDVDALADDCLVSVVRTKLVITREPGSLVTILPVSGPAVVSTDGLLYPLKAEELAPTRARGLSNVLSASEAAVTVDRGVVLVFQPGFGRVWDSR